MDGDRFVSFSGKTQVDVHKAFTIFLETKPREIRHFSRSYISGSKINKAYLDSMPPGTAWNEGTEPVHIIDVIYRDLV